MVPMWAGPTEGRAGLRSNGEGEGGEVGGGAQSMVANCYIFDN